MKPKADCTDTDGFDLINMNGRMYDPFLARFLSPDPFIKDATDTQSLNRYSYVLNNPLIYTDPSGYADKPVDWNKGRAGAIWVNPYFGGGPTGAVGPGSGKHWSDGYRDPYYNFMLGNSSGFDRIYGEGAWQTAFDVYSNPNMKWVANAGNNTGILVEEWNASFNGWVYDTSIGGIVANGEAQIINRFIPFSGRVDGGNDQNGGGGFDTFFDYAGNTIGGASLANNGAKVIAKEYVRQVGINNRLAGVKNAKLPGTFNSLKGFGNKLGVVGGVVIAGDILYNSEIQASHGINAIMTGIAFTGWGAPVAGIWFVADFGTGLVTGLSISDRIDSSVGSPLVDWDW